MSLSVDAELMARLHGGARFVESACSSDTLSMYSIDHCYWAGHSEFCEIVIAQSPVFGKCLFLDKEMQSSASDEAIYHEHLVHPVMAAAKSNKRVLIVGGGEAATAREVLKWSQVEDVDWVDIDGGLVDLCRRHLGYASDSVYNDPRLHFYAADIRLFLANSDKKYDVIILDLPDPDVEELNENPDNPGLCTLYGPTFFQMIMKNLAVDGSISTHCGPVRPGGPDTKPGLMWIRNMGAECGIGHGYSYHCCIPSFQSEWGFWMSCRPKSTPEFPTNLVVMDRGAHDYAFTWPVFWTRSFSTA